MSATSQRPNLPLFPDDEELLPEGSVVEGHLVQSDLTDSADYVIVGSGAGGSSAANALSSAGYSVIIMEEGPWVRTRQFGVDVYPSMKKLYRDTGTNVTFGKATISILQGSCVGGGTTINSAIAWRAPEQVIESWTTDYGMDGAVTYKDLEPHFDYHDRMLSVRPVKDDILGNQSNLFSESAMKLGIRSERIQRYDGGCVASAGCFTGCRSGKKLGMNLTYIPRSLNNGAKIYTSARVNRVILKHGRARGVHATFVRKDRGFQVPFDITVTARRGVIVAASAIQTPSLLMRSGIKLPAMGKHFQPHVGTSLVAKLDRTVAMDFGATQGSNSSHFIDANRFKIETLSLPSELVALRIPGVGPEMMKTLFEYRHLTNWAVVVRGETEGRVRRVLGQDIVQYTPNAADMTRMRHGLRVLSEMMFAAGAKEVLPVVHGMPILRSPDDLHLWDRIEPEPSNFGMMISHLFGGARMGSDPRDSVVGLDFQVHGARGVYVLDSSIFPTNLGVNPQQTIMAMASLGAQRIMESPLTAIS